MRLPLLALHICAGIVGLLSGAAALSFAKGSRRHRAAGNVFVISMLILAAAAMPLALRKHQIGNLFAAAFTFYLVATAWATARRREGETVILDWYGLLVAITIGAVLVTCGSKAANSPTGSIGGVPAGMCFFMAFIALLCAAGDARMLLHGGLFGVHRLARHLWRMCFALFIATGSLFLGQQQVFPVFVRGTGVLLIPAILPLILLIFWLLRVRLTNAYKRKLAPRTDDIHSLRA
jgi:uncharacterized membrane protein